MSFLAKYPALQHRNFRLLWGGQSLSLTGTMMQNAAVLWHVSLLAGDQKALALGMVGLVRLVPILTCALLGGLIADAFDRRRTMLVTQGAMAVFALVLAALSLSGRCDLTTVYVLTGLTAAASAFDGPARTSLVPGLVGRQHLANAVSLNTMLFQLTSVIGPALAGFTLVFCDVGWVYAVNAVSFLAVIGALLAMREVPARPASERSPVSLAAAAEGLRFVFRTPLIRATMLLDFVACFFCSATALLPIFAQDVLQVGPAGYGWLCAAPAVGAVAASLFLVHREQSITRRGQVLLWTVGAYGVATIAFGLSENLLVTMACLAAVGAADTVNMVLRNVIRQLHTPDHLRGRMVSVNLVFSQGGPQLGELEAGIVAQLAGPVVSVVSGGIGCVAATLGMARLSPVLRNYEAGERRPAVAAAPATAAPVVADGPVLQPRALAASRPQLELGNRTAAPAMQSVG
jgi:MFS family permease